MTDLAPSGWKLEPHVCRFCGGRVVSQGKLFRCSNCGREAQGRPHGCCGCGGTASGGQKGRPRCAPNPHRGPWHPAEYVIVAGAEE